MYLLRHRRIAAYVLANGYMPPLTLISLDLATNCHECWIMFTTS